MFFTSLAAPFLRLMGKRVIIQTDTFPGINWFPRNPLVKIVMQCYAWTIGMLVLKSAHQVVLLHEGLESTAKWLGLPYITIHNGVDLAKFHAAKPASDIVKKPDEIFVCYAGRLESIKGYDDLLAVASEITRELPHVKFFFVGGTDDKETLVQQHQSNQIVFTGHRQDIPSVLKKMDIFVLPSYSEGLPNVLMEAMAVGNACIASNVGGIKVLLKDGVGLTFKPGDRKMLMKQIRTLIANKSLRIEMGKRGKQRIEASFDLDREIQKLGTILTDVQHQRI
jgi:glycosyltransferase involved in cell wall biosynthesis